MSFPWRDVAPSVSAVMPGHAMRVPMNRRGMLALAFGTAFAIFGLAARPGRAATDGDDARRFVADLAGKAIATMANKSLPDAQRTQRFHDLFVASFDLPAIGQLVLGRYWHTASAEQQQQFLKLFEQQEVLTWAIRFKSYNGEKLTVDSADADAGGGWRVTSHIDRPSGQAIPLEWKVAQSGGGWRVDDLTVEGASLAITMRQDFGSVLQANGGKIDALLGVMQKKIDQLSAG